VSRAGLQSLTKTINFTLKRGESSAFLDRQTGSEDGYPVIICSCRGIKARDIHSAIDWMRASDPHTLITPGKVYRALGTSPDCGGCVRLFVAEMRHNPRLRVPDDSDVPLDLRNLRIAMED